MSKLFFVCSALPRYLLPLSLLAIVTLLPGCRSPFYQSIATPPEGLAVVYVYRNDLILEQSLRQAHQNRMPGGMPEALVPKYQLNQGKWQRLLTGKAQVYLLEPGPVEIVQRMPGKKFKRYTFDMAANQTRFFEFELIKSGPNRPKGYRFRVKVFERSETNDTRVELALHNTRVDIFDLTEPEPENNSVLANQQPAMTENPIAATADESGGASSLAPEMAPEIAPDITTDLAANTASAPAKASVNTSQVEPGINTAASAEDKFLLQSYTQEFGARLTAESDWRDRRRSITRIDCKHPYPLQQDCKPGKLATREIQIEGQRYNVAASSDGKTILLLARSSAANAMLQFITFSTAKNWVSKHVKSSWDAIGTLMLKSNIHAVDRITITNSGDIVGYIAQLDGNGYSLLLQQFQSEHAE